jgi:hypothetical protein
MEGAPARVEVIDSAGALAGSARPGRPDLVEYAHSGNFQHCMNREHPAGPVRWAF